MRPAVQFERVTKEFAGVAALSDVTFEVRPGEVHALCGENGAGKSTLIRVLCGAWPAGAYTGSVTVHGVPTAFRSVRDAERAGLAVIHQELALVPGMSVAENMLLGREPRRRGLVDRPAMRAAAARQLDDLSAGIDPTSRVETLGVGRRQTVAIGKALLRDARILVLDEPTSALTDSEADLLLDLLRELRGRGVTLIYISHRLHEALTLADSVTVLRDGRTVGTWAADGLSPGDLVHHMVGRSVASRRPRAAPKPRREAPALAISEWTVRERGGEVCVRDVALEVHAGEILGVAGLMGSGRSELLLSLFGAWRHGVDGELRVDGEEVTITRPADAVSRGMALVAEDRHKQGLVLDMGVGRNLTLATLRELSHWGFVSRSRDRTAASDMAQSLDVRAPSIDVPIRQLSGGNQQKVAIGKWLLTRPSVLLLDKPTRGVDVGAKAEIHDLIRGLADDGAAVIMVSSEAPEILALSDRVVVMRDGCVAARFEAAANLTEEDLLSAATGSALGAA